MQKCHTYVWPNSRLPGTREQGKNVGSPILIGVSTLSRLHICWYVERSHSSTALHSISDEDLREVWYQVPGTPSRPMVVTGRVPGSSCLGSARKSWSHVGWHDFKIPGVLAYRLYCALPFAVCHRPSPSTGSCWLVRLITILYTMLIIPKGTRMHVMHVGLGPNSTGIPWDLGPTRLIQDRTVGPN